MSFHPSMGPHPPQFRSGELTCLLPGLCWPGIAPSGLLDASALPALCLLLGRGIHQPGTARSTLQWIAGQSRSGRLPWGHLRLAGEQASFSPPATEGTTTLCADPVSIGFVRDALLLLGPHSLGLNQEEADALCTMLNAEFAGIGRFHAATPERWYLQTSLPPAKFQPLEDVVGRPVAYFPPEGDQATEWNRLANEIQTALFAHPVNQARQAAGKRMANALWFWGEGPALSPAPVLDARHIVSPDPALRGLAAATGMASVTPEQASSGMPGNVLWHDARLEKPAREGDVAAWKQALEALERELFAPLLQAWKSGRLHTLRFIAPADRGGFQVVVSLGGRWAFWRRPLDTERLCSLLQGSR